MASKAFAPKRNLCHLRPAWIDECLARDGDQVGLALLQDVLGEVGIDDEPDRHRFDAGLAAHALGVGHLEAPGPLDARRRRRAEQAAGGAVDHVDAARLQLLRVGDGVVHGPAAVEAVDGGDAQEHGLVLRPHGTQRFRHFEGKARAARKVAAVGIVALVRQGRQELMHQVAVRVVDLEDFEAGFQGALGRVHPVTLEHGEIGDGKLPRHDMALGHRLGGGRDGVPLLLAAGEVFRRQRAVAEPGPLHGALATGVRELDARHHVLRFHEFGDALERRDVRVRPDAQIAVGDAALVRHRGGLDEHASRASQHQPAPMREVKVLGDAIDRRVGRHGSDDDAVLEGDVADGDGGE